MQKVQRDILFRGQKPTHSFLSTFGDVKEVRLTAALGYLIAKLPEAFDELFLPENEKILKIKIEEHDESGRTDLVLECLHSIVIIEAKVGMQQNIKQLQKYIRAYREKQNKLIKLILLDSGSEYNAVNLGGLRNKFKNVRFVTWQNIYDKCRKATQMKSLTKKDYFAAAALGDYADHLEEVEMAGNKRSEVYVRDLSGPSLKLFLDRNIYKCQPQFFESASTTGYFAPYFTKVAPADLKNYSIVQIEPGISYISKIITCALVRRADVKDFLKEHDWPDAQNAAKDIVKGHSLKDLAIFLLGKPHRFLITPITKKRLNIHGSMGARFYTFEEIFEAASKGDI